jgi:tetratricopeptide (TPR) repeat protein
MCADSATRRAPTEPRDFYAVLGAEPSASSAELRAAFRDAVLRYHPDRSGADTLATRRTSILNRAWAELRDPVRRLHYDHALEGGAAITLEWPLDEGEAPRIPRRGRVSPTDRPSRWHQPQWRNVAGFRVPAEVWLAGPAAADRYIVEQYVEGQDWRDHRELYWLRYAAGWYRERGRHEDWLGTLERLVELDPSFDTLVRSGLREAYVQAGQYLRGAAFLHRVGARYPSGSAQRRWIDRELRSVLNPFRDRLVRRGRPVERAEHAELLLNYLEALELQPSFADVRAAIAAHRRAGNGARAAELVERLVDVPVDEPGRWFTLVQLLTEAGQLDRASRLLAEIARGDHPEALRREKLRGDPVRRIATARRRLSLARDRAARAEETTARRARRAV